MGAAGGGGAGEREAEVQRKKHAAVDCAFAVEKRGLLGGVVAARTIAPESSLNGDSVTVRPLTLLLLSLSLLR